MTQVTQVVVVGGGLAGLAAAWSLASNGCRVTLLESRPRLGGRASSIVDRETGELIDNCQHVSMGCCTNFRFFCERLGCDDLFEEEETLHFVAPPAQSARPKIIPFSASRLPVPAHLAPTLLRMPWFSFSEKVRIARGMRALARARDEKDEAFSDWLTRHGQPRVVQSRFWHTVLVSALSETLGRISLRHARKVLIDGFLANRAGWPVSIPSVSLGALYDDRIAKALKQVGVDLHLKAGVQQLRLAGDRQLVEAVQLRTGEVISADHFVLAVPHYLVHELLPEPLAGGSAFDSLQRLESAPIASVHLWFDRPLTTLPHAVLLDRFGHWFFNRSRDASTRAGGDDRFYCQVVISAARELREMSEAETLDRVERELKSVWPDSSEARRLHGRVITEHRAVFAPLPNVDQLRPAQQSPVSNLQLAGDWTKTGWPSTMEGAVRSGFLAAENVLRQAGRATPLVQADLPQARLCRWLL